MSEFLKNPKAKNVIVYVLIIGALAGAGFFVSKFAFEKRIEATGYVGSVKKVEGNLIYSEGHFLTPDNPELYKSGYTGDFTVEVTPETQFVKILMYMPTIEELRKTNGHWNPADLKKEEKQGILADLTDKRQGLPFKVTSSKNIYGKSKFIAVKIEYVIEVSTNNSSQTPFIAK